MTSVSSDLKCQLDIDSQGFTAVFVDHVEQLEYSGVGCLVELEVAWQNQKLIDLRTMSSPSHCRTIAKCPLPAPLESRL